MRGVDQLSDLKSSQKACDISVIVRDLTETRSRNTFENAQIKPAKP